jgi:TolB-like protein
MAGEVLPLSKFENRGSVVKRYLLGMYLLVFGAAFVFGQRQAGLSQAIEQARIEIETQLSQEEPGTGIVVLNFQDMSNSSANTALSDHVVNNLAGSFTLSRFFRVINRSDLGTLEQEVRYQNGGAVSDSQAALIGHQLGARYVITGTLQPLAGRYQFSVRVINVETAQQAAFFMIDIRETDPDIQEFTGKATAERARQEVEAAQRASEAEARRQQAAQQQEQDRLARERAREARANRFVLGVGAGASVMFSYQALKDGFLSDNKTLFQGTAEDYENTSNIAFTGQFSFGINKVKNGSGGIRLAGMFSFGEGMTIKDKAKSQEYTFSYNVFDLGIRFGIAPIVDERSIIFTLFITPYISIPLDKELVSSDLKNAKINMLFGPVSNVGALAGFSLGFKAGPGFITVDTSFKYDIKDVEYKIGNDVWRLYHRMGLQATLGYEFWL